MTAPSKRSSRARRRPPSLHFSEERARMAMEAADIVAWEWDLKSGRVLYSDNMPILARGHDVERYMTVGGLLPTIHPEDRPHLMHALERTQSEGVPFEYEYRTRMLDGKYHWILGKGKLVIVKRGRPVRVIGTSQDITERKRLEEALKQRSRQLVALASQLIMAEHRERRRLADLLHEELQQLIVAARIQLHSLAETIPRRARAEFNALQDSLGGILDLSRAITKDLAPPVLPQNDLGVAFNWLARDMQHRYRFDVHVRIGQPLKEIGETRAVLLFTAARELLFNVVKHAEVSCADLSLRRRADHVELEVIDQGKGYDSERMDATAETSGFGLFSIRERAALLGGTLSIKSYPGKGTRVVVTLPFANRRDAKGVLTIGQAGM